MVDWLGDLFELLNDNSGAVQAIATCILVLVTGIYAALTWCISKNAAKQAKASAEMARETKRARQDQFRPLLLIQPVVETDSAEARDLLDLGYLAGYGELPDVLKCHLSNVGPGPALGVRYRLMGPDGEVDKGAVLFAAGDKRALPFRLEPTRVPGNSQGNVRAIRIEYKDVFGNDCRSILRVELPAGEKIPRFELLLQ